MELDPDVKSSMTEPNDDQCFLMYFIVGTYFGPDVKGELPQKSVLQRISEGLPPYDSNNLPGSHMKMVEVERIYFHILKNADQSSVVRPAVLHKFLEGKLSINPQESTAKYPQFPDLFPLNFHPHSRFKNRYKIIENIVFLHNPETFYADPREIERFKSLTGLENFLLDRDLAMNHTSVVGGHSNNVESNGKLQKCPRSKKMRRIDDLMGVDDDSFQRVHVVTPVSSVPYNGNPVKHNNHIKEPEPVDVVGPAIVFVPAHRTKEEWDNIVAATKSGVALTGSAAVGQMGPVIGLVDIGECENSYIFRVSLPGVKRNEREFSCEVEIDGKVLIRGVTTTGEKTVCRHSQVFEMKTTNFCSPGHFSVSFQLPGPVDPQQFSGNFGTDGILEGIVVKGKRENE